MAPPINAWRNRTDYELIIRPDGKQICAGPGRTDPSGSGVEADLLGQSSLAFSLDQGIDQFGQGGPVDALAGLDRLKDSPAPPTNRPPSASAGTRAQLPMIVQVLMPQGQSVHPLPEQIYQTVIATGLTA